MGNHSLRKQLSKALKNAGLGKLYTCSKHKAYKHINACHMRSLIEFLKVKPGLKVYEYGVNQIVKEPFEIEWYECKRSGGGFYYQADQCIYESGYLSCGCGSWSCFSDNDAFRMRTKKEIIHNFHEDMKDKEWPHYLAKLYFYSLERGLDIIDDNGFLIPEYNSYNNEMMDKEIK